MAAHNKIMSIKELFSQSNSIWIDFIVFSLGAAAYGMIEILFRGHTHWTMVLTGGACVLTLYYLSGWLLEMPVILSALAGALIITCYEFFVGVIVNLKFNWDVWDYSSQPGNVLGQICPTFTAIWVSMCLVFFSVIKLFS